MRGKDLMTLDSLDYEALNRLIEEKKEITYRQLCQELNIPQLNGNSKVKQLNQLDGICEYEKRNTKYIFLRMRDTEERFLFNNRAIYAPYIEYIISELFAKEGPPNDNLIFFNTMELLYWCNMVNKNFKQVRYASDFSKVAICALNEFNLTDLDFFVDTTYEKILKPIVRSALKSMDNKKSIVINRGYKLYSKTQDWIKHKNVLATSPEGKILAKIEAESLTELGIRGMTELMFSKKHLLPKYYALTSQKCEERLGYDGFYSCYAMIVNPKRIKYNIGELKKELNEKIQARVLTAKSLDTLTMVSRKMFIDSMINDRTQYDFQNDENKYKKIFE